MAAVENQYNTSEHTEWEGVMGGGTEVEFVKFWFTKPNCKNSLLFIVNSKLKFFHILHWEIPRFVFLRHLFPLISLEKLLLLI